MFTSIAKVGLFAFITAAILILQPLNLFALHNYTEYEIYETETEKIEYVAEVEYEIRNMSFEEEENTPIAIVAERSPGEYIDVLVTVAQKGTTDFNELQIYLEHDSAVLNFAGISPIILRDLLTESQQETYDYIGGEAFKELYPNLMGSNHSCLGLKLYYNASVPGITSIEWTPNGSAEYANLYTALFVIVRYNILDDALYGLTQITPNHLDPVFLDIIPNEVDVIEEDCPLVKRPASRTQRESVPAGDVLFRDQYVSGDSDGTIMPHSRMTRAEVFQMFFNLSNDPFKDVNDGETNFIDIDPSAWYFDAVSYFERSETISGFRDGTFRPDQLMTKAEFIFFAIRFFDINGSATEELVSNDHWASEYINLGFGGGWLEYFGIANNFNPNAAITRAQSVALINSFLGRTPNVHAIRTYLNGNEIWSDLQVDHWSFYEIMEASIARIYNYDANGRESWIMATNMSEIVSRQDN